MLASVLGPDEAEIALAGGADIIDLKDPSQGALGAVEVTTVRAAVERVAGRGAVSAVIGDLPLGGRALGAAEAMAAAGVDFVKIGIFPAEDPAEDMGGDEVGRAVRAFAPLARRVRLVAVLLADLSLDLGLVPVLAEAGFAGAMLDTAGKDGRRLLDHMPLPELRSFVASCRTRGLICGLAGALEPPDIPRLLLLEPDLLGFRSALCAAGRPEGRAGPIDPSRVALVRGLIPREARAEGAVKRPEPAGTDRIFVHDLVLPVEIGAYAREHGTPQRVRFSVDAWVEGPMRPAQDLRDVVSYDLISDGIRLLVDAGHVELVETLAEQIASLLLTYPRVARVRVRLEKLETGAGTVGVEIERAREATQATLAAGL